MTDKLTSFLTRNHACIEGVSRLDATGATTPEEAWERADASDLIWAVTRPGVMSDDQRRRFLSEAVLAPIEHLLTDERSLNILRKLRTNEQIMQEDKDAALCAAADAACAASDASEAAWAAAYAARAAAERASDAAARAAYAAEAAAWAAADAARAAAAVAKAEDADASWASWAAAREAQARWLRNNFVLTDLNIK